MKRKKIDESVGASSTAEFNVINAEKEPEPTIFDDLNVDCMNELLDWLPLTSLCALSQTCKSLQRITKNYFQWNYPSEEFEVGDEFVLNAQHLECFGDNVQCLRLYDSAIADFIFAGSNINQNLREIQFDRTFKQENDITKEHINSIKSILQNVETVSAVNCSFIDGCSNYLLDCCQKITDFSYKVDKDIGKNRFQFQKYPTLRNIEIHFHPKANVTEAINAFKEQNLHLDELVLRFCKEHAHLLNVIFNDLDLMYERKFFKRLFLIFEQKAMISQHVTRISLLQGLEGINCSYTINTSIDNHITDIAKLQNIKYLNVNWLLENSDVLAKNLQQLIELETSVVSMDAVVSFVGFSIKLARFHVDKIRAGKMETSAKFDAFTLNKRRSMLEYAHKLTIYIPEKTFIKLKWSSVTMNSGLVEIKRKGSCIPLKRNHENP